ncbi:uncharacterized protein [Venturia canescens]|nr:uncharacterized protein LOC122415127 isoform X2 [Venturia canescens]XP_043282935.1 uncharacterized protein LOC122415127 isoform X2 [Venturia canescens]
MYEVGDSKRSGSSVESNEVTIRDIGSDENEEDDEPADEPEVQIGERTILAVFESELPERDEKSGTKSGKEGASVSDDSDNQSPLDPWSIVWYIGSFGGLVAFFLIVSCSEWCCRRGARQLNSSYVNRGNMTSDQTNVGNVSTETPPPPYHLFAPPPYDSVNYGDLVDKTSGEKIDIFVISVPLQSTAHQAAPA